MKRGLLIILSLLLIPLVSALSVTLDSPINGNTTNQTTILFTCSVTEPTYTITSIALYTNTSGTWELKETHSGPETTYTFTQSSLSQGSYIWNCLATNSNLETASASTNNSLTISTLSTTTIPSQSMNEDTTSTLFDLDTYFIGATRYSVIGNSSINLTIDSNNQVIITPTANWSGTQNLTFTGYSASQSISSNIVALTVSNVNDAPYLSTNISDQTITKNSNLTLNMSSYFADPDANTNLTYTISSNSYITLSQNRSQITLTPTTDWEGTQSVTITASDDTATKVSNSFTITVGSGTTTASTISISSFTPILDPTISLGESQAFTIISSSTPTSIKWYVNDVEQNSTETLFTYTSTELGTYTIKVVISDGTNEASKIWSLIVSSELIEDQQVSSILVKSNNTPSICGNGITESGETCSTCALDISCESGYICKEGICQQKQSAAKSILMLIGISIGLIIVAILIYYFTTIKKAKQTTQTFQYQPASGWKGPPSDYTDFYKSKK